MAGALFSTALELVLLLLMAARHAGLRLRLFQWLAAPGLASALSALTTNLLFRFLKDSGLSPLPAGLGALAFALVLYLTALYAQGVPFPSLRLGRKP